MVRDSAGFTLELVPEGQRADFWRVFQSYLREISIYVKAEAVDGQFEYPYFDAYWEEEGRWPYWLVGADGRIGGLALVRLEEDGYFSIAEFYVVPNWRRMGLGAYMVERLMELHPGKWKLDYIMANPEADDFWSNTFGMLPGVVRGDFVKDDVPRVELRVG